MRQKRSSAEKRYHVGILRSQEHPQRVNDPSLPSESFSRRTNTTVEHAPKFPWDQGDSFNLFKTVIRPTSNNMKKNESPFDIFFLGIADHLSWGPLVVCSFSSSLGVFLLWRLRSRILITCFATYHNIIIPYESIWDIQSFRVFVRSCDQMDQMHQQYIIYSDL